VDADDGVPVVIDPGEIIAFSSAHAHAGVANHTGLTRVSLETRTVSIADVRA
jgi:ectoine hydroxylase-related dioxygenase (phytanoyl-CoA dioxygenase family)